MGAIAASLGINGQGAGFQAQGAPTAVQQAQAQANTQQGLDQYNQFLQGLAASNGTGNQQSAYNQLQGVANGTGPNPAQAMLSQATGQNVANQAALAAGQRGAGSNAGLIARQAAQTGGALQQQAAGQGATMQANQSLGALGQLGSVAGQQVAEQQGALQGVNQSALQGQSNLIGAQSNVNSANAGVQSAALSQNATGSAMLGGAANSLSSIAGLFAGGGLADPGNPGASTHKGRIMDPSDTEYKVGLGMANMASGGAAEPSFYESYFMGKAEGGPIDGEQLAAEGKVVPGQATVAGDSYANDTVNAKLSPGEIVIPRHITTGEDAPAKSAAFVQAILAKHHLKASKKKD